MAATREIDKWPEPKTRRGIKIVVVSASRNATLSLYHALKQLGYHPYHTLEVCLAGVPHMKVLEEAVVAHNNRLSGIKPYGREEFDKWLADFDVIIEVAAYFGTDMIEAYLQDPDVKFILTEREPDKWVRSYNNHVAVNLLGYLESVQARIARCFEPWLYHCVRLIDIMYSVYSRGIPYGQPGNEEELKKSYIEYVETVKRTIPPERLCVIDIEKGLGWEQICPYLGKEIPEGPYPEARAHHKVLHEALLDPIIRRGMMKMAGASLPLLGAGAWLAVQKGPWLLSKLRKQ